MSWWRRGWLLLLLLLLWPITGFVRYALAFEPGAGPQGGEAIALLALLCDVVTVVYVFLGGDLSARFLAKALLVAVMGGLVLAYYRDEME